MLFLRIKEDDFTAFLETIKTFGLYIETEVLALLNTKSSVESFDNSGVVSRWDPYRPMCFLDSDIQVSLKGCRSTTKPLPGACFSGYNRRSMPVMVTGERSYGKCPIQPYLLDGLLQLGNFPLSDSAVTGDFQQESEKSSAKRRDK